LVHLHKFYRMEALTIYPNTKEQENLYKQLAKTLKNHVEKTKVDNPYDPKFVRKIKRSEKNFIEGKYKAVKIEDLWK